MIYKFIKYYSKLTFEETMFGPIVIQFHSLVGKFYTDTRPEYWKNLAKKKGRALSHKMRHFKCTKGATFSEKGHFGFPIKQLEQAIWAF